MHRYKKVFKQEIHDIFLDELKRKLGEIVPAGTRDEDVLIEIEKDYYSGYYDDYIVDTYLVISIKEEIPEKK